MTAGPVHRASAPVRLDFAGGWTDVAPFSEEVGGIVVNAAIELRAFAELSLGRDRYLLQSVDLDQTLELSYEELAGYGQLELQGPSPERRRAPDSAAPAHSTLP